MNDPTASVEGDPARLAAMIARRKETNLNPGEAELLDELIPGERARVTATAVPAQGSIIASQADDEAPQSTARADSAESPPPPDPRGINQVPRPAQHPPVWSELTSAIKDLPDEDKSHAVLAWRDAASRYGQETIGSRWTADHDADLKAFTDKYQDEIKASVTFTGEDKPYRHLANEIMLDPMRPGDGMIQAARDGIIPKQDRETLRAALAAQQAIQDNAKLSQEAGGSQGAKAFTVGVGRGAAVVAGSLGGAKLGAMGGALIPGLGQTGIGEIGGALVGGIGGGILASETAGLLANRIAENNETIASFMASEKLHPNISAAGELTSFLIPTPVGIARGIHRFKLVAENLGKAEALKQAAKYVAVSGGIGAVSAPVMAAIDRWKNTALDLGHEAQADLFDPKSIAANTVLAIMLGNLGVKFSKFSAGEAASIHQRGMAGQKLTPAEAEMFNTINRKMAADPNSFVFEAEQATMAGRPLGGAAAARTKPNPTQAGAQPPPASGAGAGPSASPPPRQGAQQGTGAPPPRSGTSAPPPRASTAGTGTQTPPKARAFRTQDEFNTFMNDAMSRGDADSANVAWAMNNAAGNKRFFTRWYFEQVQSGNADAMYFGNSVMHGRDSKAHAEFVRQQESGNKGRGPFPQTEPSAQSPNQSQPRGSSSPESRNSVGTSANGRRPSPNELAQERPGGVPTGRNEGLGSNAAGVVGDATPAVASTVIRPKSGADGQLVPASPPEVNGKVRSPAPLPAAAASAASIPIAATAVVPAQASSVAGDQPDKPSPVADAIDAAANGAEKLAPASAAAAREFAALVRAKRNAAVAAPTDVQEVAQKKPVQPPAGVATPKLPIFATDPGNLRVEDVPDAPVVTSREDFDALPDGAVANYGGKLYWKPVKAASVAAKDVQPRRAKSRGAKAINEILEINGDVAAQGGKLYIVADGDGTAIEVFTDHQLALEHLASMASPGEWLWSVPADYSGDVNLEGGIPESVSRSEDPRHDTPAHRGEIPRKDPFGVKFKGQGPTPSEETASASTETTVVGTPIEQVPVSEITLSKEVPQFKRGANSRGIVEPLQGDYDPTGNVLQGWRRLDGRIELISGRHRFAKAQESGTPSVAMQIHNEADGFTARHAARLDAELNIRDGQGSISDYANYIRNSGVTEADAKARGLLARAKGKAGFSIGRGASDDVFALHQSGEISDAQAQAIAEAAPGNADVQRIGSRAAMDGKPAAYIGNLIKAFAARGKGVSATQLDLLGNDDTAMREMDAQAKAASAEQKSIREQIRAVEGAAHKPAVAAKMGVDVKDPAGVQKRVAELKGELARWDNWPMHGDLVTKTRGEAATPAESPKLRSGEKGTGDLLQGEDAPFNLMGEKGVDTVKAAEEKAAADKAAAEAKAQQDRAQGDLFGDAEGMRRKMDADETGGIPASIFEDAVDFGKRVFRAGMDFARWAGEMIRHLGERIASILHRVWAALSGSERGSRNLSGEVIDARDESGALFGRGRRARGQHADALPQEERFLTTQGFWEGSADVFLKKPLFRFLGKAINRQVDLADKRLADATGKLEAWESRHGSSERGTAKETLSQYIDARESGRTSDASFILHGASPAAKDLIKTVGEIAEYTGRVSTTLVQPNGRVGVEVVSDTGVRPLRNLGKDFWPRILKGDYEAALRDPLSDTAKWRQMIADLIANGNAATPAEAEQFLKGGSTNDAANEFLGSLYRGRVGRMPAHWYDTSLEGFENWAVKWSDIVSKIEAFGQKIRPNDTDQFEEALKLTTHKPTQSFIHSVQARAYNERNVGTAAKYLLDAPRLLASGLFLTNPVTIGINAISAKVMNAFTYGVGASFGRNPLAVFSKKNHLDAYALGVLKRDMVRLLYRDDVPGLDALKNFTNGAMKVSGYTAIENLTRVDSYLTALAFLHDGLSAVRRNPESGGAMQFLAFVKRNGYDVSAIVRENGTGDATDTFLRGTIRDTQGGYAYNQVPWWTDTPLGRFLLQFSKFSTMHTRNVMTNVFKPAFVGTNVTVKVGGKTITKRVFNVRPLLYFLAATVAGGEAISLLKEKAFGIERRDATLEEIAQEMDEDTRNGLVLLGIRALNDSLTMGMLGIFGTPIQSAKDVSERSRYRNPLAPPGVSLFRNVGDLITTGWEQGQIRARDVADFLKSSVSMYRYADAFLKEQSRNAGIEWDAATLKARLDDAAFLRAASNRYAKEAGLPPQRITMQGRRAKDETTPMRQDLMDALLLGDQAAAKDVVKSYLKEFPSIAQKEAKLRSLRASVAQNQPVKVGGIAGNERRVEFMAWAKGKLSKPDVARIQAIDETYRKTANAVGLLSIMGARDEARLIRDLALERRKTAIAVSPEQEGEFFERSLRPQRRR